MALNALALAFLAGLLSILSPCVLPLAPIVLAAAASERRAGPLALAGGVALSFVAIGLFVATLGFAIGLDGGVFRAAAAVLMMLVGVLLVIPALQVRLATAGGPVSNWADQRINAIQSRGLAGQFACCSARSGAPAWGPTLGAASVLAAQDASLGQVAATMFAFGVGAAAPLIGIGLLSRQGMAKWRNRLLAGGQGAKVALGVLLVVLGAAIVSGFDKRLETVLVDASPQWLTDLTTRF